MSVNPFPRGRAGWGEGTDRLISAIDTVSKNGGEGGRKLRFLKNSLEFSSGILKHLNLCLNDMEQVSAPKV